VQNPMAARFSGGYLMVKRTFLIENSVNAPVRALSFICGWVAPVIRKISYSFHFYRYSCRTLLFVGYPEVYNAPSYTPGDHHLLKF
jgi:hypothetical protein